jgi:hypothetical protein
MVCRRKVFVNTLQKGISIFTNNNNNNNNNNNIFVEFQNTYPYWNINCTTYYQLLQKLTYFLQYILLIGGTRWISGWGTRWHKVWGTALQNGRLVFRFPMLSLEYFIDINIPDVLYSWGRFSLYQKWLPGMFPGSKGGRWVGLTNLPNTCADFLTSGSLKPLEISSPVKACNGIALPLYLHINNSSNSYHFSCSTYYQLLQNLTYFLHYILTIDATTNIFPSVHITNHCNC